MTDYQQLYADFVVERHRIYERRLLGLPAPWTEDRVMRAKKFTNVYRALDAGSQFLIKELISDPWLDRDIVLFRCFLYRYTNRPEPWIAFRDAFGDYPLPSDIESGRLLAFWREYQAAGNGIFSAAYKMFVGQENRGLTRLDWAVGHGAHITREISDAFFSRQSMAERILVLQTIPRCKTFMSMQILTDVGYSVHGQHDENEFILPGPGARAGVAVYAPGRDPEEVIRAVRERWRVDGTVTLFGRPPSLMDVQNTFCEFSKYARAYDLNKPPTSSHYQGHGDLPWPVLPAHWSLSCN